MQLFPNKSPVFWSLWKKVGRSGNTGLAFPRQQEANSDQRLPRVLPRLLQFSPSLISAGSGGWMWRRDMEAGCGGWLGSSSSFCSSDTRPASLTSTSGWPLCILELATPSLAFKFVHLHDDTPEFYILKTERSSSNGTLSRGEESGYMVPYNWFKVLVSKNSRWCPIDPEMLLIVLWTSNMYLDLYVSPRSDSSSDYLLRWIEEAFTGMGLKLLYRLASSHLCIFLISFMELKSETAFPVPSTRSTWNVKPDLWIKKLTLDHNSV